MPPTPERRESTILCLNAGSSSLKFSLYRFSGDAEERCATGLAERIGLDQGDLRFRVETGGSERCEKRIFPNHTSAVDRMFSLLEETGLPEPTAVGHRVVHGGAHHTAPERIDAALVEELRDLVPFAPLHMPGAISGIRAVGERYPDIVQVACFDTAFHRSMPETAQRFPFPESLWRQGVRKYGFHGISYEYLLAALGDAARGRVVMAHLGNGVSAAAVRDGLPLDTTMGFTPAGGFMMGTRSGDLDPGVLIYLMKEQGYGIGEIERLINAGSGLLGVSGISRDMKVLLERRDKDPAAGRAIDLFCYQARKQIGALAAVLGGLDLLVFSGGIGERAAPVRAAICDGFDFLGVRIDPERNAAGERVISANGSGCTVRVEPTNEDLMIARHTREVLRWR